MQKQKMVIGALLRDMAILDPDPKTAHQKVSLFDTSGVGTFMSVGGSVEELESQNCKH